MNIPRGITDLVEPNQVFDPFNIENLRKIYDFISALPNDRVNMAYWRCHIVDGMITVPPKTDLNECGTAACVVGWLPVIFNEPAPLNGFSYDYFRLKTGCTVEEAFNVCEPYDWKTGRDRIKKDALRAMRELASNYGYTL